MKIWIEDILAYAIHILVYSVEELVDGEEEIVVTAWTS